MKTKINRFKFRDLILSGITTEELNSKYDYSEIIDMSWMFDGCSSLKSVPLFDTRNVQYMNGMFYCCSNMKSVPLFDTRTVNDMSFMFYWCSNLRDIDPYNFQGFDFSTLDNKYLKEKYPELYI